MKEALLKKRYGIPAALALFLALTLVLSGTALAWYSFTTNSTETTVQEPLSTTKETEFSATMYPGDSNTWTWKIVNSADTAYSVKADLTYDAPDGVSITKFVVGDSDETEDLLADGFAVFGISAGSTVSCSLTIHAAEDAESGDVSVSLEFSRE